jgi:hypothetical protein
MILPYSVGAHPPDLTTNVACVRPKNVPRLSSMWRSLFIACGAFCSSYYKVRVVTVMNAAEASSVDAQVRAHLAVLRLVKDGCVEAPNRCDDVNVSRRMD